MSPLPVDLKRRLRPSWGGRQHAKKGLGPLGTFFVRSSLYVAWFMLWCVIAAGWRYGH